MSDTSKLMEYELPGFWELFHKLVFLDLAVQLPGNPIEKTKQYEPLSENEIRQLVGYASVLSFSSKELDQVRAYEIATRVIELKEGSVPLLVAIVDILLSRIGNFPSRNLLRKRYTTTPEIAPSAPMRLSLERTMREIENSVSRFEGSDVVLTDFQYELFETLDQTRSVSVSAPTSAGKSFVMGLDLVRRLQKGGPACVVYLVPTRALIREVAHKLRNELRTAGMDSVPVRSVPFPIEKEQALLGAVYVLTQERLMSLLHSPHGKPWITTLVIDEAQNIQDGARGIILQSAIEATLRQFPFIDIHFASPLIKNPEYLLALFGRVKEGKAITETVSPVSQNLILISEVHKKPNLAKFEALLENQRLDLGIRDLGFSLRGSTFQQRAALAKAITQDDEATILFANRAADTESLADALVDQLRESTNLNDPKIKEFIDFLYSEIHSEYPLIKTLPYGVAFHYGDMPSIVRARVEDLFKEGVLKYVCCTSTLLQGVNLPARHIVIENPKRGSGKPMQRRDFLNLAGRAGRLMQEFHGNIWCLRPASWEDDCFQGEALQEIHSAMNDVMKDGGTAIQRVLANEAKSDEVDLAEAAFGKVFSDFIAVDRNLIDSEFKTAENQNMLAMTNQQCIDIEVTLPADTLDANRAVRPDRLQALYDYLKTRLDVLSLLPIKPNAANSTQRMQEIIRIVQEQLANETNDSYKFYSFLASTWIHNTPLKQIISQHIDYLRSNKNDNRQASIMIRELLGNLEKIVRFRLVKYFIAYTSILALVLQERGENEVAETIEPFHIYLECGACEPAALNLIALGFSRVTALAIHDKVSFSSEATPEQCLTQLSNMNIESLNIPKLCIREIHDILGR